MATDPYGFYIFARELLENSGSTQSFSRKQGNDSSSSLLILPAQGGRSRALLNLPYLLCNHTILVYWADWLLLLKKISLEKSSSVGYFGQKRDL